MHIQRLSTPNLTQSDIAAFLRLSDRIVRNYEVRSSFGSLSNFLSKAWIPCRGHYTAAQREDDLAVLKAAVIERKDLSRSPFLKTSELVTVAGITDHGLANFFDQGILSGFRVGQGKRRYFIPSIHRRLELGWSEENPSKGYFQEQRSDEYLRAQRAVVEGASVQFGSVRQLSSLLGIKSKQLSRWWDSRKITGFRYKSGGEKQLWIPSLRSYVDTRWRGSQGLDREFELSGLMKAIHDSSYRAAGFVLLNPEDMASMIPGTDFYSILARDASIVPGPHLAEQTIRPLARVFVDALVARGMPIPDRLLEQCPLINERNILVWTKREGFLGDSLELGHPQLKCTIESAESVSLEERDLSLYEVVLVDESVFFENDGTPLSPERCEDLIADLYRNYDFRRVIFYFGDMLLLSDGDYWFYKKALKAQYIASGPEVVKDLLWSHIFSGLAKAA